ncbi:MAG: hypothetical protein PHG83_02120 [Patescibacteria group bacterium]|nr:hypothetical protein [Patescibacteria group bacterium]
MTSPEKMGSSNPDSNKKVEFVDFKEDVSVKVSEWLLQKGYELATCTGQAISKLDKNDNKGFGILFKNPNPSKRFLGLGKERKLYLGDIWFRLHGADEKNWVFEIYGSKNVECAKQLATEMTSIFDVNISVNLEQDESKFENLPGDDVM